MLTSVEHAVTGAPQIVPDSSACRELFSDVGLLVPITLDYTYETTLTVGKIVSPVDVAVQMEAIYADSELYKILAEAGKKKFTAEEYSWKAVSKIFKEEFEELW